MSAPLPAALARVEAELSECVAVACVDMTSGDIVAERAADGFPREVLELAAVTAADLLRADVDELERLLGAGGRDVARRFDEVVVLGREHVHLLFRSRRRPEIALVCVCRPSASPAVVGASARVALAVVDAALGAPDPA